LFSSCWNGTQSIEQLLGGGNLQVRPAQLLDAQPAIAAPAGLTVSAADVERLLPTARAQWNAAGIDPAVIEWLENVTVLVDDFAGDGLAWAMPGMITIDRDAAGYGWFVDATPGDSVEFVSGSGRGLAAGRVDLLTVLTHELGHLAGEDEIFGDSTDVMGIALGVGTRRLPHRVTESPVFRLPAPWSVNDDASWSMLVDQVFDDTDARVVQLFGDLPSPLSLQRDESGLSTSMVDEHRNERWAQASGAKERDGFPHRIVRRGAARKTVASDCTALDESILESLLNAHRATDR
jgi:hypothetical protein